MTIRHLPRQTPAPALFPAPALLPALAAALALLPDPAAAYIGPGAGLSAIGTLLALGAAVLLAIVGFVWYPVKRLIRAMRPAGTETPEQDPDDAGPDGPAR